MPPYKKPKSLEALSLNAAATLVLRACANIEDKYGNVDEEVCRRKLETLQQCLISKIRPLFDALCQEVLDVYFSRDGQPPKHRQIEDFRVLLSVLLCEKIKRFNLWRNSRKCNSNLVCFNTDSFWKTQISKLTNIVSLDIAQVKLSNEMFKVIPVVCKNLREISVQSNLEYSSKESVYKLLECKKLIRVRISFVNWLDKKDIVACIKRFVREVDGLQEINFDEMGNVLLGETKVTSLLSLTEKFINLKYLTNIIHLCPSLHHLDIDSHFPSQPERNFMLEILAKSSLPLTTLILRHFSFTQDMTNLLKLKGKNLLRLTLCLNAGSITPKDILTIGDFCPILEELEIVELFTIISPNSFGAPKFQRKTQIQDSRIFNNLRTLAIKGDSKWDQTILPLILKYANNLKDINLSNVFASKLDALSTMLEASPLKELQNLTVVSERYGSDISVPTFSKKSIQRLIDSCSKLTNLQLDCVFEDEAILYLEDLKVRIKDENLDLNLTYKRIMYATHVCSDITSRDYVLFDEY